jgi:hypothetical protein
MLSRSDLQKLLTAKLLKQGLAFPFCAAGVPLAFSQLQMSGDWRPLRRMAGSSVDPLTSVDVERCFQVFVKSALTEGSFISINCSDPQNANLGNSSAFN